MRQLLPLLALAAAAPLRAQTAPDCSALPNAIWLQIGDTQEPLIKFLGKALRHSTVNPMTVVYITAGSCVNTPNFYDKVPITAASPHYIPDETQLPNWDPSTASPTCNNTVAGHAVDIANAALFVSTCNLGRATPADVVEVTGPNQAYIMAVPAGSSQQIITAEQAHYVWGFGNAADGNPVTPWNDVTQLFGRTTTKSTLLTWAAAVQVSPANKWKGQHFDQSDQVRSALLTTATPEKAIGILGAEVYDANRAGLKELAFRWFGQNHGFFADSDSGSKDKKNLRDGHYAVWSPTVWMEHVDPTTKVALDPRTQFVIDLITGKTQPPQFDVNPLTFVIPRGLVPQCAMKVTRSVEAGPLSLFAPDQPCGCYYEQQVSSNPASFVPSGCTQCADSSTCGGGTCRFGFCEAR